MWWALSIITVILFAAWLSGYPKIIVHQEYAEDAADLEQDWLLSAIFYDALWIGGIMAVVAVHEFLWIQRFFQPQYVLLGG